jgi:hypothetical protein
MVPSRGVGHILEPVKEPSRGCVRVRAHRNFNDICCIRYKILSNIYGHNVISGNRLVAVS